LAHHKSDLSIWFPILFNNRKDSPACCRTPNPRQALPPHGHFMIEAPTGLQILVQAGGSHFP
jgi:hypothetical protein